MIVKYVFEVIFFNLIVKIGKFLDNSVSTSDFYLLSGKKYPVKPLFFFKRNQNKEKTSLFPLSDSLARKKHRPFHNSGREMPIIKGILSLQKFVRIIVSCHFPYGNMLKMASSAFLKILWGYE